MSPSTMSKSSPNQYGEHKRGGIKAGLFGGQELDSEESELSEYFKVNRMKKGTQLEVSVGKKKPIMKRESITQLLAVKQCYPPSED